MVVRKLKTIYRRNNRLIQFANEALDRKMQKYDPEAIAN
jgi:hypothetical protein